MGISEIEADELELRLTQFMEEHIYPSEEVYVAQLNGLENRFSTVPLMEELKAKAREAGLWNLWMPRDHGGLSNEQYCPLAEIMGRVLWSPEVFNCNAPDTGNMEVFLKYGSEDRKHNVPFRQIVKIRVALFQTFGWRAGSSWVVVQADTYKLTSCFLSR